MEELGMNEGGVGLGLSVVRAGWERVWTVEDVGLAYVGGGRHHQNRFK